ncbi:Major Facilitator Superfamily protein [Bacillus sp. 491mf]|uniref:MFS transporter n=1 Tax=Bacillus sp. 491mf TaxID=1761755 RepID=UPI0008EAD1B3|nr:MFS transporter [Bacillus sp. 491mf]SFD40581.1 Major Facilitator Superfamily protein [Bacillus sp. 491mf]
MKKYSKSFKALWVGEVVSEFGGAAGGILNGLLLYQVTGSKEWMGVLWLIYFIPSLLLQIISTPFLNYVVKEKVLRNIQLIRSFAYLFPLAGYITDKYTGTILGLIILQCTLGLLQPIYASISFSLLPDICKEEELTQANGLLDATIRLMSFIAPGATSLLLLVSPIHFIYVFSSIMFFISFLSLLQIPIRSTEKVATWSKRFWWAEMKTGYRIFFKYPSLLKLSLLSSTVQFAVGTAMVIGIPFIKGELNGHSWEYAIFSGAFPIGYALGMVLLTRVPKTPQTMYLGLIGGGLSFVLLFFVHSIPLAWICELFGGIAFPLFNAQSAAVFQREAPKDRLPQLSAVRLLFLRITMPIGIVFASSSFLHMNIRQTYGIAGLIIILPGLFYLFSSLFQSKLPVKKEKKTS